MNFIVEPIPNILADRYASNAMKAIWSHRGKIVMERDFWIAVMKAQRELGLDIPAQAIEDYESVKESVSLDSIKARERELLHDVKARIEEFNDLAGHEHIHKGLTSRDLTENVEQLQIHQSLLLIRFKSVAALIALATRAGQSKNFVISARTHNVAAQPTTIGKRLVMFGEEILLALEQLNYLIENYPVRGIKGPVGTQLDQLTLFNFQAGNVAGLEEKILKHLGIRKVFKAIGQVYPRSLDLQVVNTLLQLASGPSSCAKTLRLMAGHELLSEGFGTKQVGSSAMPHKMNTRSCERINGFYQIIRGFQTMVGGLSGDQWNEGDVSCSVVRRVVFPDCFFAMDGMLETFITVLRQMEYFPALIKKENRRYFPFLATTTILMEAVKAGAGREEAHEAIKEHALAVTRDLRDGHIRENDLMKRLADDTRIPLKLEQLNSVLLEGRRLVGAAGIQVDLFIKDILSWQKRFPEAEYFKPEAIL